MPNAYRFVVALDETGTPLLHCNGSTAQAACEAKAAHAETEMSNVDWLRLALVVAIVHEEALTSFDFETWRETFERHPWWASRKTKTPLPASTHATGRKLRAVLVSLGFAERCELGGARGQQGAFVVPATTRASISIDENAKTALAAGGYTRRRSDGLSPSSDTWLKSEPSVLLGRPLSIPDFDTADLEHAEPAVRSRIKEARELLVKTYQLRRDPKGGLTRALPSLRQAILLMFPGRTGRSLADLAQHVRGTFTASRRDHTTSRRDHVAEHATRLALVAELSCFLRWSFDFDSDWYLIRSFIDELRPEKEVIGGTVVRWAPARVLNVAVTSAAFACRVPDLLAVLMKGQVAQQSLTEVETVIVDFCRRRFPNRDHGARAAWASLAFAGASIESSEYAAHAIEKFSGLADASHKELIALYQIVCGIHRDTGLRYLCQINDPYFSKDSLWSPIVSIVREKQDISWKDMCAALSGR